MDLTPRPLASITMARDNSIGRFKFADEHKLPEMKKVCLEYMGAAMTHAEVSEHSEFHTLSHEQLIELFKMPTAGSKRQRAATPTESKREGTPTEPLFPLDRPTFPSLPASRFGGVARPLDGNLLPSIGKPPLAAIASPSAVRVGGLASLLAPSLLPYIKVDTSGVSSSSST